MHRITLQEEEVKDAIWMDVNDPRFPADLKRCVEKVFAQSLYPVGVKKSQLSRTVALRTGTRLTVGFDWLSWELSYFAFNSQDPWAAAPWNPRSDVDGRRVRRRCSKIGSRENPIRPPSGSPCSQNPSSLSDFPLICLHRTVGELSIAGGQRPPVSFLDKLEGARQASPLWRQPMGLRFQKRQSKKPTKLINKTKTSSLQIFAVGFRRWKRW